MKKIVKLNEGKIRKMVAECVKKSLNEIFYFNGGGAPDFSGEYEYGVSPDNLEGGKYPWEGEKGKGYFTKNGIINREWNRTPGNNLKMWITTTFLGHRHLALKLGGNWSTATQKRLFNAYSVDSHCLLIIIKDEESGLTALVQYGANGIELAADKNDRVLTDEQINSFRETLDTAIGGGKMFEHMFSRAEEMCRQEDEFFANKTSKTYDRLRQ